VIARLIWPIVDEQAPITQLCAEAAEQVPHLLRQTHARATGPGRFGIADSRHLPGSGRTTRWVLTYECPAVPAPRQPLADHVRRAKDAAAARDATHQHLATVTHLPTSTHQETAA
jgi:hypothetical protein